MAEPSAAAAGVTLPARLRNATAEDVPELLRLVHGLAAYQGQADAVRATEADLATWLFGPDAVAAALVAEVDARVVGIAIWYRTYSTWTGVPGIYLEDLFLEEGHRGSGLGRDFFTALAAIATANSYQRMDWEVADWNESSIAFYESLGATRIEASYDYRLTADRLREIAG
ncbi:GNAT family N-acetyltransferase [Nocardioides sambongensis]|uniref:GNAT family N-acetyltransferase n=1 Tax=Nocardioides sambongensis TaxID=2589074 RepID=UPI0018C8A87D|nr:GNAT family N-acetyltransferase [Nocardioides sambongensis]